MRRASTSFSERLPPRVNGTAREVLIFALYLLIGGVAISYGGESGPATGPGVLFCRVGFFLPCLGFGRFYRAVLEHHDLLGNVPYFSVVLGLQLALFVVCGSPLTYVPSWGQFPEGVIVTYATTALSIAFLLRVCKILAPALEHSRTMLAIADNTYSIMSHHIAAFFIIKFLFWKLSNAIVLEPAFDQATFLANMNGFFYYPRDMYQFALVYVIFGIAFSLVVHHIWIALRDAARGLVAQVCAHTRASKR